LSGLLRPRVFEMDKSVRFGIIGKMENRMMELHAYIPMVGPFLRNLVLSEIHDMRCDYSYSRFNQNSEYQTDIFSMTCGASAGHENLHNSVDEALLLKVCTNILDFKYN